MMTRKAFARTNRERTLDEVRQIDGGLCEACTALRHCTSGYRSAFIIHVDPTSPIYPLCPGWTTIAGDYEERPI